MLSEFSEREEVKFEDSYMTKFAVIACLTYKLC